MDGQQQIGPTSEVGELKKGGRVSGLTNSFDGTLIIRLLNVFFAARPTDTGLNPAAPII